MLLKHWIANLSEKPRSARTRRRSKPHADAVPAHVENLEQRALLSAVGSGAVLDLSGLDVDPSSYATTHVLVRFQPGSDAAHDLDARELVADSDLWRVELPEGLTVSQALATFSERPDVIYAQPDYVIRAQSQTPTDYYYAVNELWGLNNVAKDGIGTFDADIDAPEAWDITTGSSAVTVAVIDSGIDYTHRDLYRNIWINQGEIRPGVQDTDTDGLITFRDLNDPLNADMVTDSNDDGYIDGGDLRSDSNWFDGKDTDGNGYTDDLFGYDFHNGDNDPMDDHRHGTHVAGIIGATANDAGAAVGVAWDVSLMGLKFLDATASGLTSNAVQAISYAVNMGAEILNNSWGSGIYEQPLAEAIQKASDAGRLVVAAAGNGDRFGRPINNDSSPQYPASHSPVPDTLISVAATDRYDRFASFSNYGATSVDLAAPGVGIWSTIPLQLDTRDYSPDGYSREDGTSMAAPFVAGAAALLWSANPSLSAMQIKDLILHNADDLSGEPATVTNGRLNAYRALAAPPAPTGVTAAPQTAGISVTWEAAVGASSYNVYRSTTATSRYQDVPLATVTSTTYTDSTPDSGITYYYCVTAVSNGNESGRSSEVSAMLTDSTAPAAPTGLSATADDAQAVLDWADSSEGDLAGYNVYRAETTGGSYAKVNTAIVTASGYTDTGLTNGTSYDYVVTAVDMSGNESVASAEVSVVPAASTAGVHVADLAGSRNLKGKSNKWEAFVTVTIHDQSGNPVGSATVTGAWSGALAGTVQGTTGSSGTVTFATGSIVGESVTFSVTNVAKSAELPYRSVENVETTITILKSGEIAASSASGSSSRVADRGLAAFGTDVAKRDDSGTLSAAPSLLSALIEDPDSGPLPRTDSTHAGRLGGTGLDPVERSAASETDSWRAAELDSIFADPLLTELLLS